MLLTDVSPLGRSVRSPAAAVAWRVFHIHAESPALCRDALSTVAGCVWHSDIEVPPGSFAWTMEYCLAFCKWPSTGTSQGKRLPCCTRASVEPQGTVAPFLNRQQWRRR